MAHNTEKDQKVNFRRNFKIYFNFVKNEKAFYLLLFVLILLIESARVAEKYIFKLVIDYGTLYSTDSLLKDTFISILLAMTLAYATITIVKAIFTYSELHLINRLDANIIYELKTKFFNHILSLSHIFHTTHKTGSLISRLSRGSRAVEVMTDFIIFNLLPLLFQLAIISVTFLYFDITSSIVVILTVLVFILFNVFVSYIQQSATLIANNAEDKEKGNIGDIFTNIDSIKYYGKEKFIKNRYASLALDTKTKFLKLWDYGKLFQVGDTLILGLGTFFLIYFSVIKFLNGEITLGTITFIYTSYLGILSPLYGFVHSIRRVYQAMADFEALFNYEDIKNDIIDKENAKELVIERGDIQIENLSFRYHQRNVLSNVNLNIKSGQKVALVGHSGSGKTTLVKLLYRLYDPITGEIKIDGKNIKDFKQESLRSELSIVPQEAILFDDTIYNNILFSNPSAKRHEVMQAIKFAQLDNFVKNLPKKEQTIVGERGIKLSGGEKQRVSIARAILANKRVLVLDEATSALDSKTEHEIQKALQNLMQGRTSIVIAHRLSTILSADKIVVLDKGKIVQVGKHSELIKTKGVYQELWNLQKGGYIKE